MFECGEENKVNNFKTLIGKNENKLPRTPFVVLQCDFIKDFILLYRLTSN